MLYHLIYISKATHPLSSNQLAALLEQSRAHNETVNITGMLLYVYRTNAASSAGRFMQVMEGEQQEVLAVFNRIQQDSRHHEIQVLEEMPIRKRIFRNWTMGFKALDASVIKSIPGYLNIDNNALLSKRLQGIDKPINYLKSFYQINRAL